MLAGPSFIESDVITKYVQIINFIFISFMFSCIYPSMLLIGIMYVNLLFYFDKYNLVFTYRKEELSNVILRYTNRLLPFPAAF